MKSSLDLSFVSMIFSLYFILRDACMKKSELWEINWKVLHNVDFSDYMMLIEIVQADVSKVVRRILIESNWEKFLRFFCYIETYDNVDPCYIKTIPQ